ncbi:MAG: glycosyltransferase family 61 protein [Cyanobacteriota bacterium]
MTPLEQILLPATVSYLGPFKVFAYPTRLSGAWQPRLKEIHIPAYSLDRPALTLSLIQGSSEDVQPPYTLNANSNNWLKKFIKETQKKYYPSLDLGDSYCLDARYETDKNIAHILKNVSPGLMTIKSRRPQIPEITVILPQNASEMAQNAYRLLGFSVICTNQVVKGRLIQAPTGRFGQYENFYPELFGSYQIPGYQEDTPKRIFISRRGQRRLLNEAEIEELLTRYGFQKFYYEDIPISQQWSCTKNAEVVVALHGAAMASLVFNQRGVKVIELFHPGYVTTAFRTMSVAVGGSWCGVTGQITPDVIEQLDYKERGRHFAASPTRIDLECLEKALGNLEVSP